MVNGKCETKNFRAMHQKLKESGRCRRFGERKEVAEVRISEKSKWFSWEISKSKYCKATSGRKKKKKNSVFEQSNSLQNLHMCHRFCFRIMVLKLESTVKSNIEN